MEANDESFGWLLYKQRFWVLFICMFTSFSAGIVSDPIRFVLVPLSEVRVHHCV